MSASLVVLLPVLLLGIVSVFCFVGCVLQTGGVPYTQYSSLTVLGNPAIVAAYWPLDETMDTALAHDLGPNGLNGQYVDLNTVNTVYPTMPAIYPWLSASIPNPPAANVLSAAAPLTPMSIFPPGPTGLALGQLGLVGGDVQPTTNNPNSLTTILKTCMVVNGGYVHVPFDKAWNPPSSFTLEAWVGVGWQSSDAPALRAVLDGRGQNPQGQICQGFALIALPDDGQTKAPFTYHWAVMVGNGNADFITLIDSGQAITLFVPGLVGPDSQLEYGLPLYYLAVTYESSIQTLTLFVGEVSSATSSTTTTPPTPPLTPTPLYVMNTASPLYIGAGAPYMPLRPMSGGPLFPFVGAIQDVAIYNTALQASDIKQHFVNGMGNLT